jgi:iron(III) transport system permease protein
LALAVVLAALLVYPILRIVVALFWKDGSFSLGAFAALARIPGIVDTFFDTAIVAACSVALALVLGSFLAWLNERTDARMGVFTDVLPFANLLVPTVAKSIGWLLLLSPTAGYLNAFIRRVLDICGVHLTEGPLTAFSWPTLIFVYTLSVVPFVFLVVSAGFKRMDPSLEEQSRMCGVGMWTTFRKVTLPSLKPSLLGAAFLAAWWSLAVFSIPIVLAEPAGIDLLSVRIVKLLKATYPPETAAAVLLGVVVMIVLGTIWLLQRRALAAGRFAVLGGKSSGASRIRLGWKRPLARSFMIGYVMVAVLLPILALLLVTLRGFWTTDISLGNLNLNAFGELFARRNTRSAVQNSAILGATVATITIAATAVIAWWSGRSRSWLVSVPAGLMKIPAAVSSIVIGLGFILAFAGPPFQLGGTVLILFLAYVVVSLPEGSILAEAAAGRIGRELDEASSVSGARRQRTYISVSLPLMAPALAAGWALIFVRIVGDLEIAAMLSGFSNQVVGFQILDLYENGGYNTVAALALFVTVMSLVVSATVLLGVGLWSARGGRGRT